MQYDLDLAHKRSIKHRAELTASSNCGCFFCCNIFPPSEIEDWTDDNQTALCPKCGIDSVIGDASGYVISEDFLANMNGRWF